MSDKKKHMGDNNDDRNINPEADAFDTQPSDVFELINKYGTYEIQPTATSGNSFPEISQGYNGEDPIDKHKWRNKRKDWYSND